MKPNSAGEKYKFRFRELSDKDVKSLKILDLIIKKGIISRTEISKTTGINIVSISNYIHNYIGHKLIIEKGFDVSTGGRKPELIELNKNDNRVIGVEIGENCVRAALTDIGLNVLEKSYAPRHSADDAEEAIRIACALIDGIIKKTGLSSSAIRAIGIGTAIDDYASIGKIVETKFGVETFIGDEPSCAAFSEKSLNDKVSSGDMLYIYSDIGCGVVIREDGNRVSRGESRYLSPWSETLGVLNLAKSDVARGVGTSIVELAKGRMENITEEIVTEAARSNDEVALSIIRSVGMSLGLRIAYLINLFDPKSVVVGGGVERAGSLVLEPIKKTVRKLALKDRLRDICGFINFWPDKIPPASVELFDTLPDRFYVLASAFRGPGARRIPVIINFQREFEPVNRVLKFICYDLLLGLGDISGERVSYLG